MKKIFCFLAAFAIAAGSAWADEGMWMLPLLQKMNQKAMKAAGCKLSPEAIYSINHSSIKDAVVQFGGGCTGEIISDEGLLVTNHHCGYGAIQKLSSVEHNYLANGYWAMNRAEELPVEGLSVTFLESITDITPALEKAAAKARKACKDSANVEELAAKAYKNARKELREQAMQANPGCEVQVQSFYNDNVWYLIVYKVYRDVRFVGAPPSSIGKFGADTDNWMWPRHTCDFSMFRVYANKDNEPAEYAAENVPLKAKSHLTISLAGVQEGDYSMVMGYPGRTTRFQTSPELEEQIEINDIRIAARTIRQNVLMEDMLADPAIKIKYASKYSGSSNGWKKWQGMKLAFDKLDIIGRAKSEEADFVRWIKEDPKKRGKYTPALEQLRKGVETEKEAYKQYTQVMETLAQIELVSMAGDAENLLRRNLIADADTAFTLKIAADKLARSYKDYSPETDAKVAKALLRHYRDNAAPEYASLLFDGGLADLDIDAYVDKTYSESVFRNEESMREAFGSGNLDALRNDPASLLYNDVLKALGKARPTINEGRDMLSEARKLYTAGLLEWRSGEPSYPDANFTMRLSYGNVKGYSPKDGVWYRHYTTLAGVMEKEDPDNWEFVVPEKLKELYEAKDYGQYANAAGELPACFLTNNDITGGNSGSPVLNAKGELVGLAFDGNWESMSSDVMFEPDLQRCICVDIRYVLFIVDKFGGAGYLIKELDITRE